MNCLLGILAFFFPRMTILLLWLFSEFLHRAYDTWIWPVLGFVFMPLTVLAYAGAINWFGAVEGWGLVMVIAAVLFDLGIIGSGRKRQRRRH